MDFEKLIPILITLVGTFFSWRLTKSQISVAQTQQALAKEKSLHEAEQHEAAISQEYMKMVREQAIDASSSRDRIQELEKSVQLLQSQMSILVKENCELESLKAADAVRITALETDNIEMRHWIQTLEDALRANHIEIPQRRIGDNHSSKEQNNASASTAEDL